MSRLSDGSLAPLDLHLPFLPSCPSPSLLFLSFPFFPASLSLTLSLSSSKSLSWNCLFLDYLSPSWTVGSRGPNWPVRVHLVPKNSGARVVNSALDVPKRWKRVGIQNSEKDKRGGKKIFLLSFLPPNLLVIFISFYWLIFNTISFCFILFVSCAQVEIQRDKFENTK